MDEEPQVACKRCGKCCLAAVNALIADADIARWRRKGRDDILHIIGNAHAVWAGDHLVSAQDGRDLYGCPFLKWEDRHFTCTIYETRPEVCRGFAPGSSEICPQYYER